MDCCNQSLLKDSACIQSVQCPIIHKRGEELATSRRRTKNKRHTRVSQKNTIQIQTAEISDEQVNSIGQLAFLLTFSYITFSILLKIAFTYKSFANRPGLFNKFDLMYLLAVIILPTVLISYSAITGMKKIRAMSTRIAYRKLKSIVVVFSTLLTLTTVSIFYALGIFAYITNVIYASAPKIGTAISSIISTILGWIVSGIIGNFFYDILKRKYLNKLKLK